MRAMSLEDQLEREVRLLESKRERLLADRAKLDTEIASIDFALARFRRVLGESQGVSPPPSVAQPSASPANGAPRASIASHALQLIQQNPAGLESKFIIEYLDAQGVTNKPNSVYSALYNLKQAEKIVFDKETGRYAPVQEESD